MKQSSLEIIRDDFIERLNVLQNVDEIDKLEVMLLVANMFSTEEEYNKYLSALHQSYQKRKIDYKLERAEKILQGK